MLSLVVPLFACGDPGRFVEEPKPVLERARTLIVRMAATLGLGREDNGLEAALEVDSVAEAVALALGSDKGEPGIRAINRALVLGADHELNASTFAARVAASTGADLYGCVSAALAALSGPRHGGAVERIDALVAEIAEPGEAERVVHERARRGEGVEGFGHPLYPRGDPRGTALMDLARELAPESQRVAIYAELAIAMERVGRGSATIDMGLAALCAALGARPGSAAGLFAVSRCAGWVAHILEQYAAGYLVRPRARYQQPD